MHASTDRSRGRRRQMAYRYGRLALVVAVAVIMACATPETTRGAAAWGAPRPLAPCMYVFGDSLVDNGNNNDILSLARANYRPYGIDFREGPPGRFTNGRTMVDFLSDMLGLRPPLLPPYAAIAASSSSSNSSDDLDQLARGANFASGAAGVRAETGSNLGEHYPLSEQVEHFRAAVGDMAAAPAFRGNATRVAEHLARCVFFVGMGSNDYLNNYFMPAYYDTAQRYSPKDYAAGLLQDYAAQLAELYRLGARKFVVAGVGLIGCIPYELARMDNDVNRPSSTADVGTEDISISIGIGGGGGGGSSGTSHSRAPNTGGGGGGGGRSSSTKPNTGGSGAGSSSSRGSASPPPPPVSTAGVCNETINSAIAIYNRDLLAMVKRFNRGGSSQSPSQLPGSRFVFLDTASTGRDLAANAAAHGFTVLDRGCCGVGRNNGQITCLPLQRPCDDRRKYMFWDAFHPTEAANRIYAAKAFGSNSTTDAYPFNVSRLAAM